MKVEKNREKYRIISFSQSTQNLMPIILHNLEAEGKWTPVSKTDCGYIEIHGYYYLVNINKAIII